MTKKVWLRHRKRTMRLLAVLLLVTSQCMVSCDEDFDYWCLTATGCNQEVECRNAVDELGCTAYEFPYQISNLLVNLEEAASEEFVSSLDQCRQLCAGHKQCLSINLVPSGGSEYRCRLLSVGLEDNLSGSRKFEAIFEQRYYHCHGIACGDGYCFSEEEICDHVDECPEYAEKAKCKKNATCGIRKFRKRRIVNGLGAYLGEVPWQATIYLKGRLHCGGSILSDKWILTAAHCVSEKIRKESLMIKVGELNVHTIEKTEQKFTVKDIHIVDSYVSKVEKDNNTLTNDIALIELDPSEDGSYIQFNQYASPICLPLPEERIPRLCETSGWGSLHREEKGPKYDYYPADPSKLQKIDLPVRNYTDDPNGHKLVAMKPGIKRGISNGDSGGPLYCEIEGVYKVFGVTSYYRTGLPFSYFEDVRYHLDWIHELIN